MCARYTLKSSADVLQEYFDLDDVPDLQPRYNIAPTQAVPGIIAEEDGSRKLKWFQWGLIPFWAKDPSIGHKLFNARAETVHEKPAFRNAFKRRRCLVPADGFYEWVEVIPGKTEILPGGFSVSTDSSYKSNKPYKQPMYIGLKDGAPFAFAGLWEFWQSPEGDPLETCAILTTEPNDLLKDVHNRMPVILSGEDLGRWIGNGGADQSLLMDLLRPFPAQEMRMHPVGRGVSNPRLDSPECVAPFFAG